GGGPALAAALAAEGGAAPAAQLDAWPAAALALDGAGRLYLARYAHYQAVLARALAGRLGWHAPAPDLALLRRGLERLFVGESLAGQRLAAATALCARLTLVAGGPGTGKTTTVTRVLALAVEQALAAGTPPPRVLLVAPTGKAAQRLGEAVARGLAELDCAPEVAAALAPEARTIHRALGPRSRTPGRFVHDAEHPLGCDLLVCDEASMVDLALLAKLLAAVPAAARVVLLGDPDQLAAVDAGAAFADAYAALAGPDEHDAADEDGAKEALLAARAAGVPFAAPRAAVRLRRAQRYAETSAIAALARAVRRGDADDALAVLAAGPDVALCELGPRALGRALDELAARDVAPYLAAREPGPRLAALGRFRLLCAHRRGPAGVADVNVRVERELVRSAGLTPRGRLHYDGRPLLVTRNDYRIELYNGELGVEAVGPDGALGAFFPAASPEAPPRALPLERLPPHETAFAMTVHRSQGSEFERVALVLSERPSPLVSRELVYTAVTRARRSLVVLGSAAALRDALGRRSVRHSGLADALAVARADEG
ncbi:MAG: exodeoxyribonuclease V subunit alpha, partial [Myxococcales bacterium]|nr:exodeoxyribonuclease V subunit alpha [Myxococcales bacterium]